MQVTLMRSFKRKNNDLRPINLSPNFVNNADGSCMIEIGNTRVICTATIDSRAPIWLKGSGKGWVTAEYGMLPRSTNDRMQREAKSGKQSGRTQEIQRLIGRSLRASIDLDGLAEKQIIIDCDVIQADGGTRTASITGGWLALKLCIEKMLKIGIISKNPLKTQVAAISCGIVNGEVLMDLDYEEDSTAEVDANIIFTKEFELVEVQSSSEEKTFLTQDLLIMLDMVKNKSTEILQAQLNAIK